jgi:hypothetical protein
LRQVVRHPHVGIELGTVEVVEEAQSSSPISAAARAAPSVSTGR